MKSVLITAGSTIVPIDRVRSIANIFKGRTGSTIARCFAEAGWSTTILTSNRELLVGAECGNMKTLDYTTYDQLAELMEEQITRNRFDVIIHSAAISDYQVAEVMIRDDTGSLRGIPADNKVSSSYQELFLRMTQTKKLVDQIRKPWGFSGILIKFKLEVGLDDAQLIEIATRSMRHSDADIIVANCLEWAEQSAIIIDRSGVTTHIERKELAGELLRRVS